MRPLLALLAASVACCSIAATATAKPLGGTTAIRDVKVVAPTAGAERGSLLVWVRARHGGVTASGRDGAVAGATHRGKVTVRVPGLGRRTATRDLAFGAGERGYAVRFRGAGAADAVDVHVTATQAIDLDGDGDAEDTRRDTSSLRGVTPEAVAQTIAPPNGTFGLDGLAVSNGFAVQGGEVEVFWVQSDVGCVNDVVPKAPIDPVTGAFAFTFKGVQASGTFAADGLSATVDASWQGVMGAGGPKCKGALPTNSAYRLTSQP